MWHSIKQIGEKIKHFYMALPVEVLFGVMIVLIGFSGFGLGKLSAMNNARQSVQMHKQILPSVAPQSQTVADAVSVSKQSNEGSVVASKKGKKYHYPWCSGAKRMSPKNKRWFKSTKDARNAGYLPAKNCKGLK